jgi:hypothetical protein
MNRALVLAAAVLLGACSDEEARLEGAQLLAPFSVEFSWNEAYNRPGDALVAVVPVDLMVYDGATGEPVRAALELEASRVAFVDPRHVGAGAPDCTECVWDAHSDEYLEFPVGALQARMTVETDRDGLARVYAVVDVVQAQEALAGGGFVPVVLSVTLGDEQAYVDLVPR